MSRTRSSKLSVLGDFDVVTGPPAAPRAKPPEPATVPLPPPDAAAPELPEAAAD